jgi:hypothetical protein
LEAGGSHTCGITDSGEMQCWGSDQFGATDSPSGEWTAVGAGHVHSCGVTSAGSVECWGCESESPEPNQGQCEPTEGGTYLQIGGGTGHSCALSSDGLIDCWGCGEGWNWDVGQCDPPLP